MNTNTGSFITFAALIVAALGHFGIIVEQNTVITIIAGGFALYGVIHQYVITKKVVKMAKEQGVLGLK